MAGIDAFLGSWRELKKEGFDEMAAQLGLDATKTAFLKQARVIITYKKDNDDIVIDVGVLGQPSPRTFRFQLGKPYDSASIDDSPLKSVVNVDGDRLVETHTYTTMDGMVMNIERCIEAGNMIVVTKVGDLQMKSIYEPNN